MNLLKNLKERVTALEEKASEKKVASANLYNSKWYRFAKLGSYNALGLSCIVDIWTRYSSTNNSAFTLSVNVTHNAAKITQLSGLENVTNVLDKIRVVKDTLDDNVYLEVYYGIDAKTNLCRAEICSNSSISMLNFIDTTETVTVLAELDLQFIKSWTPVLENCSVTYTVQKGNYVKIGNLVHFEFQLQGEITAVDSTAYAFISGLPLARYGFNTSGSCHEAANVLASGRPMPTLRIALNGGATKVALQKSDSMGISIESWVAGRGKFYLSGSGTYIVS